MDRNCSDWVVVVDLDPSNANCQWLFTFFVVVVVVVVSSYYNALHIWSRYCEGKYRTGQLLLVGAGGKYWIISSWAWDPYGPLPSLNRGDLIQAKAAPRSPPTTVTAAIKSNWVLLFLQGWTRLHSAAHISLVRLQNGSFIWPRFYLANWYCMLDGGAHTSVLYLYKAALASPTTQAARFLRGCGKLIIPHKLNKCPSLMKDTGSTQ